MIRFVMTCAQFVALLALPCTFAAADPLSGPYISLGAGADLLQNLQLSPANVDGPSKRAYQLDTGYAINPAFGWGLGNGLRLEVSGDFTDNNVRGLHANFLGYAVGTVQQFGGFANAYYDLPLAWPVQPYLGAGVGYQALELDRTASAGLGTYLNPTMQVTHGAFAGQAIAGVSYAIPSLPGLTATLEYRLVAVDTPAPYLRSSVDPLDTAHVSNIFNHEVLLGLRYALWQPAPPPFAEPTLGSAPSSPPAVSVEQAHTYLVFFDWDRSDLTSRAKQIIAAAASASTQFASTRIEVNGYTDLSGTASYNQSLSVRRAESVEAELVKDGVAQGEISVHGYGESNPLISTATGVREPQNRRVEIILK